MSASTSLLPKPRRDDHPIFFRVCHAPWNISQKVLFVLRAFVALYVTTVFGMYLYYEIVYSHDRWLIPFKLEVISYLAQVIYFVMTLVWTYMHLYHSRRTQSGSGPFLAPPKQSADSYNRVIFSIFYTATLVFPAVVTLGFWCFIAPHGHPAGGEARHIFGRGWLKAFCILNIYAFNSFFALVEVVLLSSIKRMQPIWGHVVALILISGVYGGWVYIGYAATGRFAYYFMDHHRKGSEVVVSSIFAFIGVVIGFFAVFYGLTGVREKLSGRVEQRKAGYHRLPQ